MYAGLGRKEEAIREGKLAVELYPTLKDAYIGPYFPEWLAQIYVMVGQYDAAMDQWAKCFALSGEHQLRIVNLLSGRLPARDFLEAMQPDWRTLREIWARYRQPGQQQELVELAAYAAKVTERDVQRPTDIPPVYIWLWQAAMYADLGQKDQALACLEKAYQCGQHVYNVRYELGYALKEAGRILEAEPHLRWCLARRPENKGLSAALLEVTKLRQAERDPEDLPADGRTATWRR